MVFIDHMSILDNNARMSGGLAPTLNETLRKQNFLVRLDEQGQLLNPVWGLRFGGDDPRLTIGALDPEDYQGEINWVPELQDSGKIEIDAFKGYQGNVLSSFQYPVVAGLSSISHNIFLTDIESYLGNDTLIGPQDGINVYPPEKEQWAVLCNGTKQPEVEFSVQINGVDYPMKKSDMYRPGNTLFTAKGYCNANIRKSDSFELGITFLRSVYLAYRFPTGDCPGYYGFAIPKGFPAPTSTQKPRATPTDASKCLALVAPTSTPTPTIALHEGSYDISDEKYKVFGLADDQWVALRHPGDLPSNNEKGGAFAIVG
ncbi:hypothetical protein V5O48_007305 [Marasmius crinis-equi]|uniref:Peptidase A1 domain-containing protein n=1 Tax=Marasmius crinis-equi TaxID=585013 RepID=A0ABR3FHT8_9AGAR